MMMTTTRFNLASFFAEQRLRVDEALDRALPPIDDDPGQLKEGMRYAVLQGGKRIRPMVTLAACLAAEGALEAALPACCALEMVHAYSLVHDDLPAMDNDLERRGLPTAHVKYGEANAILIGDALLTFAFEVLARGNPGLSGERIAAQVGLLARHAGIFGMVGGQALDLALGQDILELPVLERVHALKTGGLYAAAGAMGALAAGAGHPEIAALERWGLLFGIAFQHADDVLDDDQRSLRAQAIARVDALVDECARLTANFGERAAALNALADWVRGRAHTAATGLHLV
jgi:geranylgeranyl diphosphate synthase type II